MRIKSLLCLALLSLLPVTAAAAASPSAPAGAPAPGERHPLRGVVNGIMEDRSSLLVKHEEIPGVMRAMTMLFQVDAATLKAVKQGDAITGLMSRRDNRWILEEVKVVAPKRG
jgi:Cu/Ag efflux protein CusF